MLVGHKLAWLIQGCPTVALCDRWQGLQNVRQTKNLKDNSTMDKTDAQIVSYGILYLNPCLATRLYSVFTLLYINACTDTT